MDLIVLVLEHLYKEKREKLLSQVFRVARQASPLYRALFPTAR